jgi:hypothetical protein
VSAGLARRPVLLFHSPKDLEFFFYGVMPVSFGQCSMTMQQISRVPFTYGGMINAEVSAGFAPTAAILYVVSNDSDLEID